MEIIFVRTQTQEKKKVPSVAFKFMYLADMFICIEYMFNQFLLSLGIEPQPWYCWHYTPLFELQEGIVIKIKILFKTEILKT